MRIPTRIAMTVSGLALSAGSILAVGATVTQANAATTTGAPQTVAAASGHSSACWGDWDDCDDWGGGWGGGWGDWDDWDD